MLTLADLLDAAERHPLYADWDFSGVSHFADPAWRRLPTLDREMTHVGIDKRARAGNLKCNGCTRRRLAVAMGEGNRGQSCTLRRAAKRARDKAVVIESGPWAGRYALLGPMGHRLGYRGADVR